MQADRVKAKAGWRSWTVPIGIALLVAYPLSIGPVFWILHPTGRQQSMHRQYWAEVVPVVYQPLAFVCSKSWIAESIVCRYLALWGEGPSCGTYPK
jgi:hypothetical protein